MVEAESVTGGVGLRRLFFGFFFCTKLLRLHDFAEKFVVTARWFLMGAHGSKLANGKSVASYHCTPRGVGMPALQFIEARFVTVSCFDFAIMKLPRTGFDRWLRVEAMA